MVDAVWMIEGDSVGVKLLRRKGNSPKRGTKKTDWDKREKRKGNMAEARDTENGKGKAESNEFTRK